MSVVGVLTAVAVATLVGVALALSGTGGPCSHNADCLGKYCYQNTCSCQHCEYDPVKCPSGCAAPAICVSDFNAEGTCITPAADGAPCSRDAGCNSTRCSGSTRAPGVCIAIRPPGGACTSSNECPQGSSCVRGRCTCTPCERSGTCRAGCTAPETCINGACAVGGLPLGAPCEQNAVCASMTCVAGACAAKLALGANCTEPGTCASGECLSGRCACQPACVYDAVSCPGGCARSQRCALAPSPSGSSYRKCVTPLPDGANCTLDEACLSGHCSSPEQRCAPKLAPNSRCSADSQCASGKCAYNGNLWASVCTCSSTCSTCQAACPASQQCVGIFDLDPHTFCVDARPSYGTCHDDRDCASLHCDTVRQYCVDPLHTGDECASNQACPGNTCYGYKGPQTCVCDTAGAYDAEKFPAGCVAPATCLVNPATNVQTCGPALAEGEACYNGGFVPPGSFCYQGRVRSTPLPVGTPATFYDFCQGVYSYVLAMCVCDPVSAAGCPPGQSCRFLGLNRTEPPYCGQPYAAGQVCAGDASCASGVCSGAFFNGVCTVSTGVWKADCRLDRDCISRRCVAGRCACDLSGVRATCPSGMSCVSAFQGAVFAPTCAQLLSDGQSCSADAYCSSGWCREGVCAALLPPGSPCSQSSSLLRCASGSCDEDGVCACTCDDGALECQGGCPAGETCKRLFVDISSIKARCGPNEAVGAACQSDYGCATEFCYQGLCHEKLGLGVPCQKDAHCYSQSCDNGRCTDVILQP